MLYAAEAAQHAIEIIAAPIFRPHLYMRGEICHHDIAKMPSKPPAACSPLIFGAIASFSAASSRLLS